MRRSTDDGRVLQCFGGNANTAHGTTDGGWNMNIGIAQFLVMIILTITLLIPADAHAQAVSCRSLSLDPVDGEGTRLLERYYTPRHGVGGLGCWVHKHPNGRDHVVTPHSWGRSPNPGKMGLISTTLTAITDARRVFAPLGTLNLDLFILLNDVHENAHAYWPNENQCWIEAGPRGGWGLWREPSSRFFKGTVAHEIGHCFLMENIPNYTPRSYVAANAHWWDESGAEFLSSLVYKTLNHEHINARLFDLDGEPFTQPYTAYVLLQHYASRRSERAVIELLNRMHRQRSDADLRAYFRSSGFESTLR